MARHWLVGDGACREPADRVAVMRICAGGLLVREAQILLARRSADRAFYPGVWDVVGGHCEAAETPAAALARELEEEIGVTPRVFEEIAVLAEAQPGEHGEAEYHIFIVTAWSGGEPRLRGSEHSDLRWLTVDQALALPLAHPGYGEVFTAALGRPGALVHLKNYDPTWPIRFAEERQRLVEVLDPWMAGPIEHVGSTAVPGLLAKPIIDIMVAVRTLEDSRPAIDALRGLGYGYFPHRADVMHWFCKPSPWFRTHHLHLVPFRSPLWTERIVFRDHLRTHPRTASEYAALKARLAEVHGSDREAYTEAKGPFIQRILAVANKE
jgi:GrpB-like predicted nucleotidyltransferase (UPF0157 family)/8-oxo-dGTP pyrophosphatase MutT (NUDIX family)